MSSLALTISDFDYRDYPDSETTKETLTNKGDAPWIPSLRQDIIKLTSLPQNWDSYDARKISVFKASTSLGVILALAGEDTPKPTVVPLPNGCLQYEWHINGVDLEIEFRSAFKANVFYENLLLGTEWEGELAYDFEKLAEFIGKLSS